MSKLEQSKDFSGLEVKHLKQISEYIFEFSLVE